MDNYKEKYEAALAVAQETYNTQPMYREWLESMFPELKESEDERIRKAQLDYWRSVGGKEWYGVPVQETIAWLENQGEYHLSHDDEIMIKQLTEYFTTGRGLQNTNETVVAWLNDVKRKLEKQGEQKPVTDFSDLRTWKYIVDAVWTEKEGIGQYLDSPFTEEVAKRLQKRFGNIEQNPKKCIYSNDNFTDEERKVLCDGCEEECELRQKSAWSEKELDSITAAINNLEYLKNNYVYHQMGLEPAITFLKSLKDRVVPQPKQEWSEEDKNYYNTIIAILENTKDDAQLSDSQISFLKSLIPQNRWKPSGEQMQELHNVFNDTSAGWEDSVIESLYNDLKKLMKE